MRLLVTRPEPDATTLRTRLMAQGHDVVIEPLLYVTLHPIDETELELDDIQALIATSRNGVRSLAQSPALQRAHRLPIYTVGSGTGSTAKSLGFRTVIEGPTDAHALVALIALQADVNAGPLLHLAGETQAVDVAGELRHLGFHVIEPTVYSTQPAEQLSRELVRLIRRREIDGVLLFSPQTARTYARLIQANDLASDTRSVVHFCLSSKVAAGLVALCPPKIVTTPKPNLDEMLALITRTAPQLR